MTPWEQEQERLRKIAAGVKRQEIWAQVYSAVFAIECRIRPAYEAKHDAVAAANAAVKSFEEHANVDFN